MTKENHIFISNATYKTINYAKGKGEWVSITDPNIIYNSTTEKYQHINTAHRLQKGIIKINEVGQPVIGYFEENNKKYTISIFIGEDELTGIKGFITLETYPHKVVKIKVQNSKIAEKLGSPYYYGKEQNNFVSYKILDNVEEDYLHFLLQENNTSTNFLNKYGYCYSLNDHSSSTISSIINSVTEAVVPKLTNKHKQIYNLISPLSFGVELETSSGIIPERSVWETGFIPLKDGSISGYEFTSIPFVNEVGIKALQDLSNTAIRNCEINKFCSMHLHIGNFNFSKAETVAFYMLSYHLQQEMFDFVPPYKRDETYFASKNDGVAKDHCKPLRGLGLYSGIEQSIDEQFQQVMNFVVPPNHNDGANKWNKKSRYFWVNMLPFMTDGQTIEFRLHEPTLNYEKILLWLLICSAMVKYTKKHTNFILSKNKISLSDIFNVYKETDYGTEVANLLSGYVRHRTNLFMEIFSRGGYADASFLNKDTQFTYEEEKFRKLFI